jgi:predicted glycosyltransferase
MKLTLIQTLHPQTLTPNLLDQSLPAWSQPPPHAHLVLALLVVPEEAEDLRNTSPPNPNT